MIDATWNYPTAEKLSCNRFQRVAWYKMLAISITMHQAISPSWDFTRLDVFGLKCQNDTESQFNIYFLVFKLLQGSILLNRRFLNAEIHARIYALITTLIQTEADNCLLIDKNSRKNFTYFFWPDKVKCLISPSYFGR